MQVHDLTKACENPDVTGFPRFPRSCFVSLNMAPNYGLNIFDFSATTTIFSREIVFPA